MKHLSAQESEFGEETNTTDIPTREGPGNCQQREQGKTPQPEANQPNGPAEVQCECFGPISGLNFGRWILGGEFLEGEIFWGPLLIQKTESKNLTMQKTESNNSTQEFGSKIWARKIRFAEFSPKFGFRRCKNLGTKIEHKLFSGQIFRAPRDIPAKIPGYPVKKFSFAGFRRTYRTFWPPPLHVEDPPPPEDIRTKKFGFGFLFLP